MCSGSCLLYHPIFSAPEPQGLSARKYHFAASIITDQDLGPSLPTSCDNSNAAFFPSGADITPNMGLTGDEHVLDNVSLKRQRSQFGEENGDNPARKVNKRNPTAPISPLKRSYSPSRDIQAGERLSKSIKLSSDTKSRTVENEPDLVPPPQSIELGGVSIKNLSLVSLDEHGDEI